MAACGGGSADLASDEPVQARAAGIAPAGVETTLEANAMVIRVGDGPAGANTKTNVPFVSVKICAPGDASSSCRVIDHVILDTGSTGLRLVASALQDMPALKQQSDASGDPYVECAQFNRGYAWGPVKVADVYLAGERASSVPIQVIGDPRFSQVPDSCPNGAMAWDTVENFGGNGLLGVDSFREDCGSACVENAMAGTYYVCPREGTCISSTIPIAQQVTQPVALLANDNNGLLIDLPAIDAGGARDVAGQLVLGVGTRGNNGLGSAKVYALDSRGSFTTVVDGRRYTDSFVDSGSNYLFFQSSALTTCPNASGGRSYCPASPSALGALVQGANGATGIVDFSIANVSAQRASNPGASAFNNIGASTADADIFNWGLPFFFGRKVFIAVEGGRTSAGPGPYVAF
ncbi:DUF3443 domain-containing protein [Variovorax sp. J22R133]|uniref:DUF3443 domain-containing protein n=1 Tax=Variovorax brevis TaxID=3053503 RepID=UPI00257798FF|nr:DUF3443 domain-containing protein [Variovorax sp. J22R133]MDM0116319.1 DUF3443 domain-containing protein [Variovorax sp. J22R133]